MPIKREGQGSEQSGPIVRSAFCCLHLLSLPAFVLCLCPDQNPFDLLQTIGNIIHQRLLFPLSLSFSFLPSPSFSLCFRLSPFSVLPLLLLSLFGTVIFVLPAASHKSLCKALSSHFVVFHPNLSIMFHSLSFCLFNSKAKS